MKPEPVTLKDIAQAMGVSTTTVHRALQGKGRISEQTREEVRRVAARMGYRANYMAAALKRKEIRLAVALPEPVAESRYYYRSLWQGVRRFFRSVPEFPVTAVEIPYALTPQGNGAVLQQVAEGRFGEVDGLLSIAVDHRQSAYFLEQLAGQGIPVALVGADLHRESCFCRVTSYDATAGRLAGELLTAFGPKTPCSMIVTGNLLGDLTMADQYDNARGFEEYLEEHAPHVELLRAHNSDSEAAYETLLGLLAARGDVRAVYSCSARHTVRMCRAVTKLGLEGQVLLVGNDRFPESVELLQQGVLSAIVDKKTGRQSYLAMRTLFDRVVKGEYPAGGVLRVAPSLLLRSNVQLDPEE